jgi:beta-phosphoglucomutase-like phosphatase (HAD superfamily)
MPGLQFRHILERLAKECGFEFTAAELDEYAANEVNAVINAFKGRLATMPFCLSTLELCRVLGIPFGIASSSALKRLYVCLEETGQSTWVNSDYVTSAQEKIVKRGKPHPDVWFEAQKRLNSTPTTSIGIEDSPSGVRSCVAAGMPTIGLLQALPEEQREARRAKLEEENATIILNSWAEISAVLLLVHQHFQ